MSDINLQRFVDINLVYHEYKTTVSTRDTVVMVGSINKQDKVYTSYADMIDDSIENNNAKIYFDNGGVKLKYHYMSSMTASNIVNYMTSLPDDQIVVMLDGINYDSTIVTDVAESLDDLHGIKRKIFVSDLRSTDIDSTSIKSDNVAVKVIGNETTKVQSGAIAAYLSKIDFHKADTVQDYCYTEEKYPDGYCYPVDYEDGLTADALLGKVLDNNYNISMKINGRLLNFGGNMSDEYDLVNTYSLIVLQQLLTERIFNLLQTKIKGSSGLAEIQAVVADEMGYFLKNGYLTTDKVWTDDDLNIVYNDVSYNIIKKNEPLLLGYKFVVLPIQSLTAVDKVARKAPPMYLIVADSYGIRAVTINGEVI